ncbi:DUF3828 domain-containing protein [Flavobacterium oreochromis]|uniref:DUF3828 domain-containing protein n=1 Tax=Flavobacterium oreochromis TaxID=2906078 RepID=UPI001CE69E79|nr:DUF3828 domain-containing protein [Flavobacterium oreochromis]QYS86195.1 DUF3828 domain-containing protein [Flavobacterium oreochromis]
MYNGKKWVSDFKQRSFFVHAEYIKANTYAIYRIHHLKNQKLKYEKKSLLIVPILFICCKGEIKDDYNNKNSKGKILEQQSVNDKSNLKDTTIVSIDEGVKFLKKFYNKFYYDENKNFSFSDQKEFLSKEINDKINSLNSNPENLELDYDPFIKAQDYDGVSIKKTINCTKEAEIFVVTFVNFEEDGEVRLEYKLAKNRLGKIEIVNILNDSLLRIK